MRLKPLLFLAAAMLLSSEAYASMHPNAVADGWLHFMWHMQLIQQAAATGNWSAFWQLFYEQSVCATTWETFVFTPLGFMIVCSLVFAAVIMAAKALIKKFLRRRTNQVHVQAYAH